MLLHLWQGHCTAVLIAEYDICFVISMVLVWMVDLLLLEIPFAPAAPETASQSVDRRRGVRGCSLTPYPHKFLLSMPLLRQKT